MLLGTSSCALEIPGEKKAVEIPVQVIVTEGGHQASIRDGETIGLCLFREFPFSIIYPEVIGRVVIADMNVEVSVGVDIHEGWPGRPRSGRLDSRLGGGVDKPEGFLGLEIDSIFGRPPGQKEIWPAISIEISHSDAPTGKGSEVDSLERVCRIDWIDKIDAGFFG